MYAPRADDDLSLHDGTIVSGFADSTINPPERTKAEEAAYRKELRELQARRRKPGFAPWDTDEGGTE